ncbi:hypothetical protein [Rhodococcus jostii]|uniref:hypothetical protein n=1 Tax=Rhodococcus jostii TaxID=132919 RepID=UPI0036403C4C
MNVWGDLRPARPPSAGRKYQANGASTLFRTLKSERLVFTNPTSRVRVGAPHQSAPDSLSPQSLRQLGDAAERNPALSAISDYLAYRHERWPHSSNQYLMLTRRTAHEQGSMSQLLAQQHVPGLAGHAPPVAGKTGSSKRPEPPAEIRRTSPPCSE